MVPGSYSGLSTNIYQEGVRIPPIKILEGGKVNRAAMALLMANMRVPEEREGDFNASLGACRVAERRIRRIYERYGTETVHAAIRINLDRTERRLRERITQLPDGSCCYEDYLEYYEEGRLDPVLVRIELTVDGDGIVADFAGSNPQVPGVVNSSLAVTGAGVFVTVKSTLDPGGAVNDGAFRPIELRAPAASVVDVRSDAPAGAHGEVRKRAVSVALGALAQIIPERVSGDLCGTSFPNSIGGWNHRRGRQYVYYEAPAGGNGGFAGADGSSAFANVDFGSIRTIQTAESIENEMPLLVERCELRADSGGEGAQRGGLGLHREIRVLGEEGSYSVLSDRAAIPPFGVGGGTSSRSYRVAVRRNGSENVFPTPGKVTGHPVRRDDVVVMESGGGGGYGDPLERDPEAVRADVREGFVSAERARDGYGVVLDAAGEVGEEATAAAREALGRGRFRIAVRADETDPYTGVRGRRRTLRLAAVNAQRLGVGDDDLVELLGAHPAPTRRRSGPGCGSMRAKPTPGPSGWTRSGAGCSASARATRWSCAASRSPARRAAWLILRRSRTASRVGGLRRLLMACPLRSIGRRGPLRASPQPPVNSGRRRESWRRSPSRTPHSVPQTYERPSPTRAQEHRGRGVSRCGSRPCTAGGRSPRTWRTKASRPRTGSPCWRTWSGSRSHTRSRPWTGWARSAPRVRLWIPGNCGSAWKSGRSTSACSAAAAFVNQAGGSIPAGYGRPGIIWPNLRAHPRAVRAREHQVRPPRGHGAHR